MAFDLKHLPTDVAARLREFHARRQMLRAMRVIASVLISYGVLLLIATHVDRWLFLSTQFRSVLLWGVHGVTAAIAALGIAWHLHGRLTPREIAYQIEGALGGRAQEQLVTLENMRLRKDSAEGAITAELLSHLETSTITASKTFVAAPLAKDPIAHRLGLTAIIFAAALGALGSLSVYQFPLMIDRFFHPTRDLPRPSFIKLDVAPNRSVLGKGSEAIIQVRVTDQTPALIKWIKQLAGQSQPSCEIDLLSLPGDERTLQISETAKMVRVQRDLFLFTKSNLQESFTYRVRSGNAQTAAATLRVASQPRVLDLRVTAKPPAYSKLPDQTFTDMSQPLRLLADSEIEISFRADQPVERVVLRDEKSATPITPEWEAATLTARYTLKLKTPLSLEVELANSLGFVNVDRAAVKLLILEDGAPIIRLDEPPQEIEAIAGSMIEIRGHVDDDLGVQELSLRYAVNPDPRRESPPIEQAIALSNVGAKQCDFTASLDLEKTGAIPGDTVVVEVRARDTNRADAISRPATVRVMPFTRGADEQRRLAALRAVSDLLQSLAKPPEGSIAAPVMLLDADTYKSVQKTAATADVSLDENPSMQSVFDLLETEHFLTRDPRHQADIRMILGVTSFVHGPLGTHAEGGRVTTLNTQTQSLMKAIADLCAYRRARNLLWRFSGLRDESRRLRDMLGELEKAGEPGKTTTAPANDAADRVNRRAALYLTAIQDSSTELIELSKITGLIKQEAAAQLAGDINETGYLLSKGAAARRRSAANRIRQQIDESLELVRGALSALLTKETRARRELSEQYAEKFRLIANEPRNSTQAWRITARQWLDLDRLLLEREPFAPLWPRVQDFILTEQLSGRVNIDLQELLKSTDSASTKHEREIAAFLALQSQLQQARTSPNVSDVERAMEQTLIAAEFMHKSTPDAPLALDTVAQMPLQSSAENPVNSVDLPSKISPPDISTRDTCRQLAQLTKKFLPEISAAEVFKECLAKIDATASLLKSLDESLASGESEVIPKLTALVAAMRDETDIIESSIARLSIQQLLTPGANTIDDATVLGLKDATARYRQRSKAGVAALFTAAGTAPLNATSLGEVKSHVARVRVLHEALEKNVAKLASQSEGTETTPTLKRSSTIAQAALGAGNADSLKAAIASIAKLDDIGASVIASHTDTMSTIQAFAATAGRELEKDAPDFSKTRDALTAARSALAGLDRAVSRLGAANVPPAVFTGLSIVKSQLESILKLESGDAAALSKMRYEMSEWRRKIDSLANAVRSAASPSDSSAPDFHGGPERAWSIRSGTEAASTRRELRRIAQFAEARAVDGLLGALDESSAGKMEWAYAWAALRYRLERSELAGVGVSRSTQKPTGKVSDPAIEYLKSELGKARQQQQLLIHYSESTRAYLDLIGDFLLY